MARSKTRTVDDDVEYEKQTWNIYSMMLLLALLAIIIGCVFLILELKAYDWDYAAKGTALHAPPAGLAAPVDPQFLA